MRSKKDEARFEYLDKIAYEMFKEGRSITSIAKELGVKRQSLSKRLKEKYNIVVNPNGKKNINSKFFSEVNEKSMYWLGFIFADGSLYEKGNYLEIVSKDKDHVEKFKADIQSEHKISCKVVDDKKYWRIIMSDKTIYNDLVNFGVVPRKSFIDIDYPTIDKKYELDFLRGFIDGDGHYNIIKKSKEHYPMIEITVGFHNQTFANKLCEVLNSYDTKFTIYEGETAYKIANTQKDHAIKLLELLYENATVYMNRKYLKIKKYCRLNSTLQKS